MSISYQINNIDNKRRDKTDSALFGTCSHDFNKNNELHLVDRFYWSPGVSYTIPIRQYGIRLNKFIVNLYFTEWQYNQKKQRLFNIIINNVIKKKMIDIYDEANGTMIELKKSYIVKANCGELNIDIKQIKNHARLSAIEITPMKRFY